MEYFIPVLTIANTAMMLSVFFNIFMSNDKKSLTQEEKQEFEILKQNNSSMNNHLCSIDAELADISFTCRSIQKSLEKKPVAVVKKPNVVIDKPKKK